MRARTVGIAAVVGVVALLPAPAGQAAVTMDVGECRLTQGDFRATYTVVDGHATSGAWDVAVELACGQPEQGLSVRGDLLRNGKVMPGLDAAGACATGLSGLCTTAGGRDRLRLSSGMSGSWQLRVTARITGPDTALMRGDGCTQDLVAMTMTCVATSAPVVIP